MNPPTQDQREKALHAFEKIVFDLQVKHGAIFKDHLKEHQVVRDYLTALQSLPREDKPAPVEDGVDWAVEVPECFRIDSEGGYALWDGKKWIPGKHDLQKTQRPDDLLKIVSRPQPAIDGEALDSMCKLLWERDYPNGGSIYKTYESTPFHDKELYRAEVKAALLTQSGGGGL